MSTQNWNYNNYANMDICGTKFWTNCDTSYCLSRVIQRRKYENICINYVESSFWTYCEKRRYHGDRLSF